MTVFESPNVFEPKTPAQIEAFWQDVGEKAPQTAEQDRMDHFKQVADSFFENVPKLVTVPAVEIPVGKEGV